MIDKKVIPTTVGGCRSPAGKETISLFWSERFEVQGSRFKVKSTGRHELFMIYRWVEAP